MLRTLEVKNFRCFTDFHIGLLDRINLITGRNNVGKTSLLEALFLYSGHYNAQLPHRLNSFRGLHRFALRAEDVWGWLFHVADMDRTITFRAKDEAGIVHVVTLTLTPAATLTETPKGEEDKLSEPKQGVFSSIIDSRELTITVKNGKGKKWTVRATITEDGIKATTPSRPPPTKHTAIFLSTRSRNAEDDANRYSDVERQLRQEDIIAQLKIVEPRIRRLSLLTSGGSPVLNADVGIGHLMPLPFVGEGTTRLLSIALAIADTPGGTVMIDDIDSGFHYTVLTDVWKAIALGARRNNVQIFATTHSRECVQAAHEAFADSEPYDFRLYRLERSNEHIVAKTYDQETLSTALESDLEVR